MTSGFRTLPILLTSFTLAACGGTDGASFCTGGFTGGTLTNTVTSCPGCRIDDADAAIDGNGDRAARLVFNSSNVNPNGGQIILRAGDRVFPAGSMAGAFMRFPLREQSGYTNISASVVTYLAGVQQERVFTTMTSFGNIDGGGQTTFYGGVTSRAFDAVEVTASLGNATEPTTVAVFEICGAR